jgi:hypothetical protein
MPCRCPTPRAPTHPHSSGPRAARRTAHAHPQRARVSSQGHPRGGQVRAPHCTARAHTAGTHALNAHPHHRRRRRSWAGEERDGPVAVVDVRVRECVVGVPRGQRDGGCSGALRSSSRRERSGGAAWYAGPQSVPAARTTSAPAAGVREQRRACSVVHGAQAKAKHAMPNFAASACMLCAVLVHHIAKGE